MSARWMLYCYDALGLGHVRRALSIARAVLETRGDVSALLVTCSPLVDALPVPSGLDYIKLPSARKLDNRHYIPRSLRIDPDSLHTLRADLLRGTAAQFRPDLFLVDKSPEGLMGELRETLELLERATPRPRLILGWRDVLDEPDAVIQDWRARGTLAFIGEHYEEIWVYGDPAVFDVRERYALPGSLVERVRYLGYLSPRVPEAARRSARERFGRNGQPFAVVTAGGGEDGEKVMAAYLESAARGLLPGGLRSLVVLGPCMSDESQRHLRALAPRGVAVERFVPDLAPAIAAADVVVGMAGYNTACEILGAGVPAVLVPRVTPRREQWVRARRLAELGLVECLEPERLRPETLAEAVGRALRSSPAHGPRPACDGLDHVVRQFARVLPAARSQPEEVGR